VRSRANSNVNRAQQPSIQKIRKAMQLKTPKEVVNAVQQRKSDITNGSSRDNPSVGKNSALHMKNNKTLEINRSKLNSAAY